MTESHLQEFIICYMLMIAKHMNKTLAVALAAVGQLCIFYLR